MIFLADGRLVILADEVVAEIERYTTSAEGKLEAGGILIGSYRGPHVEILRCTTPMPMDRRTRFGFVRCDPGHQHAALAAWRASDRTVNFVGEWHTHPEDNPYPSTVDRNTWARQMNERKNDVLIFIIGGRSRFYCALGLSGVLSHLAMVTATESD